MSRSRGLRRGAAGVISTASILMALGAPRAHAAEVRLVHAVPGAQAVQLAVDGSRLGSPVRFGQVGRPAEVDGGSMALVSAGTGKVLARRRLDVSNADYTIVAAPSRRGVSLRAYRNGAPASGRARLRAVHAAAELGRSQLRVDGRPVLTVVPGRATRYAGLEPGSYSLSITRPGGGGGALASRAGVELTAGTSTTAVVVGSGGEPTRIVVSDEGAVAPRQGPETGLGGLEAGHRWPAAALAALLAGALGGSLWLLGFRRRRGP